METFHISTIQAWKNFFISIIPSYARPLGFFFSYPGKRMRLKPERKKAREGKIHGPFEFKSGGVLLSHRATL
jgi:hypothetical protein